MRQKIRNFILVAVTALTMGAPALVAVPAYAANSIQDAVCEGTNVATQGNAGANNNTCSSDAGTGNLGTLAQKVVNLFSIIVGVVAVIMIIYGGFRYITSGGESGSVGNAKNTLIYAIVGLIIVALAQFIVHFVLTNVPQTT